MICGRRGERGVCPLPHDHSGPCETVSGHPLDFTKEESRWNRYHRILSDLSFLMVYTAQLQAGENKND